MLTINTLQSTPPAIIHQTFQAAFADYFVAMDPREEIHLQRWKAAGVNFELSFGAFEDDQLVGFILHAPKEDNIFNLATGVMPQFRGKKIIDQIYTHALPYLKKQGFKSTQLEVITLNHPAIKVYQRAGFKVERELACFRGMLEVKNVLAGPFSYQVKQVEFNQQMRELIRFPFAFEQSEEALTRGPKMHELHELRKNDVLMAYAIYHPLLQALAQVGARGPFQEHLATLFKQMGLVGKTIKLNNIDTANTELMEALESFKLENHISQYEMKLMLS